MHLYCILYFGTVLSETRLTHGHPDGYTHNARRPHHTQTTHRPHTDHTHLASGILNTASMSLPLPLLMPPKHILSLPALTRRSVSLRDISGIRKLGCARRLCLSFFIYVLTLTMSETIYAKWPCARTVGRMPNGQVPVVPCTRLPCCSSPATAQRERRLPPGPQRRRLRRSTHQGTHPAVQSIQQPWLLTRIPPETLSEGTAVPSHYKRSVLARPPGTGAPVPSARQTPVRVSASLSPRRRPGWTSGRLLWPSFTQPTH